MAIIGLNIPNQYQIKKLARHVQMYVHILISHSFEKLKRLSISDYIKQSNIYQVKCKLVAFALMKSSMSMYDSIALIVMYMPGILSSLSVS